MALGKVIKIHLLDGSVTGIRHAEIVNWTGQAIAVPRIHVKSLENWSEARRPGIYFLFGVDDASGNSAAYIGETEDVYERLLQHQREREFWNEVVFFTSKDENLTKSHVKFLESRLIALAAEVGRLPLLNAKVSGRPSLPRGDIDTMEEFLGHLRTLIGALGYKLLEPLDPTSRRTALIDDLVPLDLINAEDSFGAHPKDNLYIKLRLNAGSLKAEGLRTDEGLVVRQGSEMASDIRSSLSAGYRGLRDELVNDGVVKLEGDVLRFQKDHLFASPSQAAAVLVGYAINGRHHWVNDGGLTLKQLEEA